MRMWGVQPHLLCQKHLCGEHLEMHMFVGTINRNASVFGYIKNRLLNTRLIQQRHDELAEEMLRRGYNHKSPLVYNDDIEDGKLDVIGNLRELCKRCVACKSRIQANLSFIEVKKNEQEAEQRYRKEA